MWEYSDRKLVILFASSLCCSAERLDENISTSCKSHSLTESSQG